MEDKLTLLKYLFELNPENTVIDILDIAKHQFSGFVSRNLVLKNRYKHASDFVVNTFGGFISILDLAALNGQHNTVKFLVDHNIELVDSTLIAAAASGNLSLVKYLIQNGIAPISDVFSVAEMYGYKEIEDYLYSYLRSSFV
jgi:hypothetical protein